MKRPGKALGIHTYADFTTPPRCSDILLTSVATNRPCLSNTANVQGDQSILPAPGVTNADHCAFFFVPLPLLFAYLHLCPYMLA